MSQWTHILGVIRYDSAAKSCYPVPPNKKQICEFEMNTLKDVYSRKVPEGSEGPIELIFNDTKRGPAITLVADLRDFGEEDLKSIVDWLELCRKEVEAHAMHYKMFFMLRDSFINCDVEYAEKTFYIVYDDISAENETMNYKFTLQKINNKCQEKETLS